MPIFINKPDSNIITNDYIRCQYLNSEEEYIKGFFKDKLDYLLIRKKTF